MKLREGARLYNAGNFWDAHEAWEDAWNALREADSQQEADFVQGMILVTAGFENARRDKELGFKRQLANGLQKLRANAGAGTTLGVRNESAWEKALVDLYLDCCRTLRWRWWHARGFQAPLLELD